MRTNSFEGKISVFGNFSGRNTFSKIVALIVYEGRIRLEVDKTHFLQYFAEQYFGRNIQQMHFQEDFIDNR